MPVLAPVLTVENGSGVTNANTYISDTDALVYFTNRGDSQWPQTGKPTRDAALVRAAAALSYWLNGRWYGRRATQAQSLDWPRLEVRDSDGYVVPPNTVPAKVQYAQCEIAKIELNTPFIQQSVSRYDAVQSERVGPIDVEFRATAPSITYYPQVIAMLRDYATIGIMPIELVIGLSPEEKRAMYRDHHGFGMNPFDFPDYFHLIKEPIYNPSLGSGWYDDGYLI